MSLSKIPVEVVEGHIFKYLAWNDLLRLRRVSKECRALVHGYMKTEKGSARAPEISVGMSMTEDYPDLKTFTEINIPTTKIYFRNSNNHQEDDVSVKQDGIRAFVSKFGRKVKQLHLQEFSTYLLNTETALLLEGLCNLESLSVDEFLIGDLSLEQEDPVLLNPAFLNLKALDLHLHELRRDDHAGHASNYLMIEESLTIWLTDCKSLRKLRLSMGMDFRRKPFFYFIMRRVLEALILSVESGNGWERIELDVEPSWIGLLNIEPFQRLLDTCAAKNVGVAGVHAHWLEDWRPPRQRRSLISSTVIGLRTDEGAADLRQWKLDKLVSLEITSARAFMESQGQEGPSANLQSLILTLPSLGGDANMLFQRLGGGQSLIALRKVSLEFERTVEKEQCLEQLINIAPNLQDLTMANWKGPPEALSRLLPRLQGLEKLSLLNCQRLEDAAFVGNDPSKPAFLQLKNLRRLSVVNLRIPSPAATGTGLAANCFTRVFRHMNLTHFEMSAEPFTVEYRERCNWMKLLLEGRFAESIEEIKWKGCRLHEVEDPELREIGKTFRSANML